MKWIKHTLIVIGILILVGVGSFVLHDVAYSGGETAGYDRGYSVGHEAGYSIGQEAGYEEGYGSGKTDGYNEGYTSGRADGYETGYSSGKTDGYDEGYILGKTDGYDEGYILGKTDGYEVGVEAGLGHGYTLKDPTYKEVITFLRQDKTDENEYVEDTYGVYVCSHFARDVGNNAEEAGLQCAYVALRYPEGGHAIIAFDTIDEGLVYFTPQTDERVKPVIGKQYYQCIEPKPGYYYKKPSFDDTIMDILVIW